MIRIILSTSMSSMGSNEGGKQQIERAAIAQVAAMFQRPSQLEKLDVVRKRADRKKAAVEAMLRTGVQSQLEGIRSAIGHLETARDDIDAIESNMQDIFQQLRTVPELKMRLTKLSQANTTHSQYAAAMENLKHIVNIAQTVEKTHEFIVEGKLLNAHRNIIDLEKARDDLMFELHKLRSERREYDKNLLKNYFGEVEKLVQELAKQIWYICSRALEAVRGSDSAGPQQLVSAIRIIEREERIDLQCEEQYAPQSDQFMPPGRPRRWRKQLFEMLTRNVQNRVEGHQFEDRAANKSSWLAKYLEACRRSVVEDLRVVKNALAACFPPEYAIYDRYVKYYHDAVTARIRDIAAERLEKSELVQLLGWIRAYAEKDMLGDPRLAIQANAMVAECPLLPRSSVNQLCDRFVDLAKQDIHDWLDKALMQEKDDWYKHVAPESDAQGCYYTQLPSILFGIIEDTVKLSQEVGKEIVPSIIDAGVDEFHLFATKYKDASMALRGKHFENRAQLQQYTATMIGIANNLNICIDSTDKLEKHIRITMEDTLGTAGSFDLSGDTPPALQPLTATPSQSLLASHVNRQELVQKIEQLKKKWRAGIQFAYDITHMMASRFRIEHRRLSSVFRISALLDEISEDVSKHLAQLMTKTWLMGSADLETICMTVEDYYNDHRHLRPQIRHELMTELYFKLIVEYVVGVDSSRVRFSNYDERHLAAERLKADATKIEEFFGPLFDRSDYPLPVVASILPAIAGIVDLRDKSLLSLEASTFVRRFSDVPNDLLTSIIQSREDIGSKEARSIAEEALYHARFHPKGDREMLKLFQMCKPGTTKRALPALESTMQNMFATIVHQTASIKGTPTK